MNELFKRSFLRWGNLSVVVAGATTALAFLNGAIVGVVVCSSQAVLSATREHLLLKRRTCELLLIDTMGLENPDRFVCAFLHDTVLRVKFGCATFKGMVFCFFGAPQLQPRNRLVVALMSVPRKR